MAFRFNKALAVTLILVAAHAILSSGVTAKEDVLPVYQGADMEDTLAAAVEDTLAAAAVASILPNSSEDGDGILLPSPPNDASSILTGESTLVNITTNSTNNSSTDKGVNEGVAGFWKSDPPTISAPSLDKNVVNPTFLNNGEGAHAHAPKIKTSETKSPVSQTQYEPPTSFQISAAIYTNLTNGHSYFAEAPSSEESSTSSSTSKHSQPPSIPFLECSAKGSTTAPIPFDTGTFLQLPPVAQFVVTPHPGQIIICLTPLELIASSGGPNGGEDSKVFQPGDAILLEDVSGVGHKLRSSSSSSSSDQETDGSALVLSLPSYLHYHHHTHVAKTNAKTKQWSIFSKEFLELKMKQQNPCPEYQEDYDTNFAELVGTVSFERNKFRVILDGLRLTRRKVSVALGSLTGVLMANWLSQVKPWGWLTEVKPWMLEVTPIVGISSLFISKMMKLVFGQSIDPIKLVIIQIVFGISKHEYKKHVGIYS